MESASPPGYVAPEMGRTPLILSFVLLGGALIAGGWALEDQSYLSALLLELGTAALLIVPLVYIERLITREIGGVRQELADLRRQAEAVAVPYERLRAEEKSGWQRTATMERQMARARSEAHTGRHSRKEVAALFSSGTDGERIFALGLMQGKISLASVDAIINGIVQSLSRPVES